MMSAISGPALTRRTRGRPPAAMSKVPSRSKRCLTRRMEQKGYGDLSAFRNAEKFIGDREPANAVKATVRRCLRPNRADVAIMLGYDARNRAVFQSYAARPCLGGPIERARGAA